MSSGRRILVVGTSGAGKTYVAQHLAKMLNLRYICNDRIIWGPDWTPVPKADRLPQYDEATAEEGWTYDGNIGAMKDPEDFLILSRADTLIWLDLPRWRVFSQLLLRTLGRVLFRKKLWHGNRETLLGQLNPTDSILVWSWRMYPRYKEMYTRLMADARASHMNRIHLTSRRAVEAYLQSASCSAP